MPEHEIEAVEERDDERARFARDVHAGLSQRPRNLSPKWLYDARGSELFERICDLEEYYPTRTERAIVEEHGPAIAATVGPRARIVEPGSGDGSKAMELLALLEEPRAYVPVEISEEPLVASARQLAEHYPRLVVQGLRADFTRPFSLPPAPSGTERTVVYFPGSTLGNFEPETATRLLARFRGLVGADGGILLGMDLAKDESVLIPAYDDSEGVTAEFNKGVLRRIRDELGGTLDYDGFQHRARYEASPSRVVLELVARGRQVIELEGRRYEFEDGEALRTEYSHKPTLNDLYDEVTKAGLHVGASWTDPRGWLGLFWLRPA